MNDPYGQRGNDPNAVRIVREVPLWGIVTMLAAVITQGFALYYGQERLGALVAQQAGDIKEIRAELVSIRNELGTKNIKDAEHDFQIEAIKARLSNIERAVRP